MPETLMSASVPPPTPTPSQALPHSRLGKLALCLDLGIWLVTLWFAFGAALGLPLPQQPEPWLDGLWISLLLALALAILALVQRGRNKKCAVLALLVTVLTPIAFVCLGFLTITAAPVLLD